MIKTDIVNVPFQKLKYIHHISDIQIRNLKRHREYEEVFERTYKEIAIAIGKPNAHRAVANACGKNPLPIIRPCHRVICSNGNVGGYSFGSGTILKKALLSLESNS